MASQENYIILCEIDNFNEMECNIIIMTIIPTY